MIDYSISTFLISLRPCLLALTLLTGCGSPNRPAISPSGAIVPIGSSISAQQSFSFEGRTFPYWVFTPSAFDAKRQLPAILLLHGGGGQGLDMINVWQKFADQTGIILVAPTLPYGNGYNELSAGQFFPQLMDQVKTIWHFDGRHVLVFGVSAGGYSSYDAATLASTYFTAAGVFAAVITPDYDFIVAKAQRKTPVAIYIGDHDEFFTLTQARRTRDLLLANGFPVHYTEFVSLDHNYGAVRERVNADFFSWASQFSLY